MLTVGEQLRDARLDKKLTVEEIAERTKIRPAYLNHLECGEYAELPGQFFAISFVNQFAAEVGLDGPELAAAARSELQQNHELPTEEAMPAQPRASALPLSAVRSRILDRLRANSYTALKAIVPVILIAGGLFLANTSIQWRGGLGSDGTQTEQTAAGLAVDEAPVPAPQGLDDSATALSDGQGAGNAASPDAQAAAATSRPAGVFDVEIRASDTVWVRTVVDEQSREPVTLQSGQRLAFRVRSTAYASFGNAGGAILLINGQEQEPIGSGGQVRHVRITQQGWTRVYSSDF